MLLKIDNEIFIVEIWANYFPDFLQAKKRVFPQNLFQNGWCNDKKIIFFYILNIIYLYILYIVYANLNLINYFYASVNVDLNWMKL